MAEMKDSGIEWIGEIPESWKIIKIKHLANREMNAFIDGDWIDSPYIINEGIRYLTSGNIGDGVFKEQGNGHISRETFELLHCSYAYPGDLVFSRLNTPFGRSCILPNTCSEYVLAVDNVVLRTDENKQFLVYLSQCSGYHHEVEGKANGTAMKRISRTDLGNISLPLAPKAEQECIVKLLDVKCTDINSLIEAKETINALLKERRQSIIYEAVTKGLNPDAPMKDSGVEWIGKIPEEWTIVPLKRYAVIRTGFTLGKRYEGNKELREYPYLRVANVQGEYTDLSDIATTQMPPAEAEQYFLHPGELLMTEGGDRDKLGRGSVWHGEIANCLHQNHVFALATTDGLNVEYLSYLTTSDVGRSYFDYTANKTTNLASTNATTILNFRIPLPSRTEQDEIVEHLNHACAQIDSALSANETIIRQLKEYRQSVIYEAVTGKIQI